MVNSNTKYRHYSYAEKAKMQELFKSGVKPKEIAKQLNKNYRGVRRYLIRVGVLVPRTSVGTLKLQRLVDKYEKEKKSIREICVEEKLSYSTVRHRLEMGNCKFRKRGGNHNHVKQG